MKVHVKQEGYVYLCEGPTVFGKMANGFVHLWESAVEIYKTDVSSLVTNFQFDKGLSHQISSNISRKIHTTEHFSCET